MRFPGSYVRKALKRALPVSLRRRFRRRKAWEMHMRASLYSAFFELIRHKAYNYEPLSIGGRMFDSRRDWEQRWCLIKTQLEAYQASSILDIGCSEGWFLRRAAEDLGCFSLGVEYSITRLLPAEIARLHDEVERCAIMKAKVGPTDIEALPRCDVVLCLSVVHWVLKEEGIEGAKRFINAAATRAEKAVIFEMGTSDEHTMDWHIDMPQMPDGQVAFVKYLLESSGLKDVRVLGGTPSTNQEAVRFLFVAEPG